MASYLPPTETLPIFDSGVFDTSNSAYLTYTSAKQLFVTYPISQGAATISQLYSAGIDTTTPASIFNFLPSQTANIRIGNTTTGSGTIRLGAYTGTSVHCGAIDCTANSINNYVPTSGDVNLCNSQTSGVLNIGTGARTTTGTINIGTGSGSTANPINIGSAGSIITCNHDLTLASGSYITTTPSGSAISAPISPTQVGCIVTGTNITSTVPTSDNVTSISSVVLTAGTWVINTYRAYNNSQNCSRILFSYGLTSRNNVAPVSTDYEYGLTSPYLSNQINYVALSTTINITATGNTTVYFNMIPTYTTAPTIPTTNFRMTAIRIA